MYTSDFLMHTAMASQKSAFFSVAIRHDDDVDSEGT
jgi:hypothetical protein